MLTRCLCARSHALRYRIFEVAISANVFFQQKKAQVERRIRNSRPSAAIHGECQLVRHRLTPPPPPDTLAPLP